MALYWHRNGKLTCAAESKKTKGCLYIDDHFHYELSEVLKLIEPIKNSNEWRFIRVVTK
jgi:hypothetical protein